mmetsp:Transcript_16722/g.47586  ORF Transcript_16722/g.47586 Transcript_16722/m.47586 type:complete len:218 (+) Transcript_16722:59-712(+)
MFGIWKTPFSVSFVEGEDGVCSTEDGGMQMAFDKESNSVTLTQGDESIVGRPGVDLRRIRWENGSVWTKDDSEREMVFEQPDLLSDHQLSTVIDRVNEGINLWGFSEECERSIIEPPARQVNGFLRESLQSFMAEAWVKVVSVLLDETLPPGEKTSVVQGIIREQLQDPLVVALNGRIDIPILTEGVEARLLELMVSKVLDSIVAMSVLGMEKSGFV